MLVAQGIISAGISTYIFWEIITNSASRPLAAISSAYLVLSFPLLFLATERFDLYLHLFLIILSLKLLYRYVQTDYLLYLFLSGPVLGLTFFVHFNTVYLLPLFFVVIAILFRTDFNKMLSVSLVFITPYLIFFVIFSYLNWIFTGDAFGFLTSYRLMFANKDVYAVVAAGSVTGSILYMLKYLLGILPVIAPCLVAMVYDRKVIFIGPFLIIFSTIYANLFYPSIYASAVFIIYFLCLRIMDGKRPARSCRR